jgi:hypothetical protein
VYRALFVHDLLVLCLVVHRLLATPIALNGRDFLVWLALFSVPRVVPLAFVEVAVAISLLVMVALGKWSFSSSSWSAHRAIMSHKSMTVVGRLRPKLWYVCFEKSPFGKQWMTSSSVMLAMAVCVSKKHHV